MDKREISVIRKDSVERQWSLRKGKKVMRRLVLFACAGGPEQVPVSGGAAHQDHHLLPPTTPTQPTARDPPRLSLPTPPPTFSSSILPPPQPPDIEEGILQYRPGGFHPVRLFEIYNSFYLVLRKLGYGRYSTVWLVRDIRRPLEQHAYYAMKVLSAECHSSKHAIYEREILRRFGRADRSHPGYAHVSHLLDDFEHRGPNGTHVCLIFELMGETLGSFAGWYGGMVDDDVMRAMTRQLLWAVKFAHDNGVIHTGVS